MPRRPSARLKKSGRARCQTCRCGRQRERDGLRRLDSDTLMETIFLRLGRRGPAMFGRSILILMVACSATVDSGIAQGRAPAGSGRKSYANVLSRPAVSPYMNLLRPDASPAQNYYTLVRPQIDQRDATLQQGGEIDSLRHEVQASSGFRGAGGTRANVADGPSRGIHESFALLPHRRWRRRQSALALVRDGPRPSVIGCIRVGPALADAQAGGPIPSGFAASAPSA